MAAALLASGVAYAADAPTAGQVAKEVRENMRGLWKSNINAIEDQQDPGMQKAVGEVRSMDLTKKLQRARQADAAMAPAIEAIDPIAPPSRTITPAVLEQLKKRVADGSPDGLALADGLFQSGQLDAAEQLYQELLRSEQDPAIKAWLLLQTGNCRRRSDATAARAAYGQVLSECPQSPWAGMAQAEIRLIDWTAANAPQAVLQGIDGARNSTTMASTLPSSTEPSSAPAAAATAPATPPANDSVK